MPKVDYINPMATDGASGPARGARARRLSRAMALAALLPAAAGAIVNGTPVSAARHARDFPWAVALVSPRADGLCTAALVSPTWVVTAAHCTGTGPEVRTGDRDRTRVEALAAVEAVRHPRYDVKTGEYDVGLVRLARPVAATPVRIATAAEARELLVPGARAVIAGWGRRGSGLPFSDTLVVSDVELRSLRFEGTRIAYFDPASGPCGGDSGGPMLLAPPGGPPVLVAIASRVAGDPCARGGGVGIYVSLATVREFIEAHVTDLPRR